MYHKNELLSKQADTLNVIGPGGDRRLSPLFLNTHGWRQEFLPYPYSGFAASQNRNLEEKRSQNGLTRSSSYAPHLHGVIKASRRDAPTIRRPSRIKNSFGMTVIGEDIFSSGGIPHLHRLIYGARSDALGIRRPSYRREIIEMTPVGLAG